MAKGCKRYLLSVIKHSKIDYVDGCTTLNILKTTELQTLNGLIIRCFKKSDRIYQEEHPLDIPTNLHFS